MSYGESSAIHTGPSQAERAFGVEEHGRKEGRSEPETAKRASDTGPHGRARALEPLCQAAGLARRRRHSVRRRCTVSYDPNRLRMACFALRWEPVPGVDVRDVAALRSGLEGQSQGVFRETESAERIERIHLTARTLPEPGAGNRRSESPPA